MRSQIFVVAAMTSLAACNPAGLLPTGAPLEADVAPAAQEASGNGPVSVGDFSFPVEISDDQTFAIVGTPPERGSYTGSDVETAANQASGCTGTIVPGDWAMLGDLGAFDLSNLAPNETSPFPGWRVTLAC